MDIKVEIDNKDLGNWGEYVGKSTGWRDDRREVSVSELFSRMAREITRQEKKIAAFEAKFGEVVIEE